MNIEPLKTSVLKADEAQAKALTEALLNTTSPKGKTFAKKNEIENGWQVLVPLKNEAGERVDSVIFELTKSPAGKRIRYDARFVTVQ